MLDLSNQPITQCFSKASLAAGATTTLNTTGTTTYAIRSKMYTFAAWSGQATPTTDYATGNAFLPVLRNKGCAFLIGIDSGGTMRVIQGSITDLDTVSVPGNFILAPQFPAASGVAGSGSTDNDFCPVGYLIIQAGATANNTTGWIFGTSNNSSVTGITYTFGDLCGWPDRPRVS